MCFRYGKEGIPDKIDHLGTLIPLGTVDFYPNYGYDQPGAIGVIGVLDHRRAFEYFIYSIKNKGKFQTNTVLADTPDYCQPVEETKIVPETSEMGYYAEEYSTSGLHYVDVDFWPRRNVVSQLGILFGCSSSKYN